MNDILSFYEFRFSGGDTMRWLGRSNPTLCKRSFLNFLHSQVAGTKNFGCESLRQDTI